MIKRVLLVWGVLTSFFLAGIYVGKGYESAQKSHAACFITSWPVVPGEKVEIETLGAGGSGSSDKTTPNGGTWTGPVLIPELGEKK